MRFNRHRLTAVALLGTTYLSLIGCQSPTPRPGCIRRPITSDFVNVQVDDVNVRADRNGNLSVTTPDGRVGVRPSAILAHDPTPRDIEDARRREAGEFVPGGH
jgi:hypothetical protein